VQDPLHFVVTRCNVREEHEIVCEEETKNMLLSSRNKNSSDP
jgi:hypothetical protein